MGLDIKSIPFSWIRRELRLSRTLARDDQGKAVKRVQEWLTLNGKAVVIDGDFGPATEYAIGRFQSRRGLDKTGVVDTGTFDELTEPLHRALAAPDARVSNLSSGVVSAVRQHLRERPREVGGANRGPWVRAYMEGNDGTGYLWCTGFACFAARQAAWHFGAAVPIRPTFSCGVLAADAQSDGRFVAESEISNGSTSLDELPRGSFFVQRRSATDWNHVGIVIAATDRIIETVEGNTNEGGSREGYEVCRRIRNLNGKDFVLLNSQF